MKVTRILAGASIALGLFGSLSRDAQADFTFKTLASFDATSGGNPEGGLTLDAQGNLYGTTSSGGASNDGTVFKIAAGTVTLSPLASFDGTKGSAPSGGLTLDASGNIYGTASQGGANNAGTVFKVAAGTGDLTALASFGGANGIGPRSGVTSDGHGNLYGTTFFGGSNNGGTVFKFAVGSNALSTLANFSSATGSQPAAGVTLDAQGNLYGTTSQGGSNFGGTAFKIAAGTGIATTLFNFSNSSMPLSGLTLDTQGNLYGATSLGGVNMGGMVFKIAAGTGILTTLASFGGLTGSTIDGPITLDAQGNIYGTTEYGGNHADGTVFEIAAGTNTITTLANFDGPNGNGPLAGVTIDAQGNLYGTTNQGGANNTGTVFELVNNGAVPEPASMIALGQAALVGLGLVVRARSCRPC